MNEILVRLGGGILYLLQYLAINFMINVENWNATSRSS